MVLLRSFPIERCVMDLFVWRAEPAEHASPQLTRVRQPAGRT